MNEDSYFFFERSPLSALETEAENCDQDGSTQEIPLFSLIHTRERCTDRNKKYENDKVLSQPWDEANEFGERKCTERLEEEFMVKPHLSFLFSSEHDW